MCGLYHLGRSGTLSPGTVPALRKEPNPFGTVTVLTSSVRRHAISATVSPPSDLVFVCVRAHFYPSYSVTLFLLQVMSWLLAWQVSLECSL